MSALFGRALGFLIACVSLGSCAEKEEEGRAARPDSPDPIVREVQERCSDFAARLCASAADCCRSTGAPFSAESCAASFIDDFCASAAQVVGAEQARYYPEDEEPCLQAWARAHETCDADWEEIVAIRREVWTECKMVRGIFEVGSGCSTSSSCAQPDGPRVARCLPHPVTGQLTCQVLEMLGEQAECPFPDGDVSLCDVGLYCTATELGTSGTCAPAVAGGEPCDAEVPANPECGLGHYCGLADGVCHRATNFGGPSCVHGGECVSFQCDRVRGTCNEARSTAWDLCVRGEP